MTPRQMTLCCVLWNLIVLVTTAAAFGFFYGADAVAVAAIGMAVGRYALADVPDDGRDDLP